MKKKKYDELLSDDEFVKFHNDRLAEMPTDILNNAIDVLKKELPEDVKDNIRDFIKKDYVHWISLIILVGEWQLEIF
jgi:hypothetical protein